MLCSADDLPTLFRHAIKQAYNSPHPRYPIGAAILKGKRLFCCGYNQFKTHTLCHGPQTLHAELHAISKLKDRWDDFSSFTLVVCRLTQSGFGMARPCATCMSVIKQVGIKHLMYTTNRGWAEEWIN